VTHALRRAAVAALPLAILSGCSAFAASTEAPTAGASRGGVPNLIGVPVMVLPVQSTRGVSGNADAELADALGARGDGVRWLMPPALRSMLARSPALDVPIDALPVGVFLDAQVDRVGDPLYGQLRRLAALANGRIALIPVEVRHRPDTPERPGAIEVVATLIDTTTGRVVWFGVVEGASGGGADPRALASAADALARRLVPQSGGGR
jgi:hypothetical protein